MDLRRLTSGADVLGPNTTRCFVSWRAARAFLAAYLRRVIAWSPCSPGAAFCGYSNLFQVYWNVAAEQGLAIPFSRETEQAEQSATA